MIRKLLFKLSGEMPCRLIKIDGNDYLERYYIGSILGFTLYLHRFVAPDGDRKVHDHPWRIAMSFVLAGSYREEWVEHMNLLSPSGWDFKMRNIRFFNWIPGYRFHRIADANPETWTLFIHGARTKGWGFLRMRSLIDEEWPPIVEYYQPMNIFENLEWHRTSPKGKYQARAQMEGKK